MSVFPSARFSPSIDIKRRATWNGYVKLRLGHSRYGSVFLVEHVILATVSGWAFLQPSFFGPPSLAFMPKGRHRASFSVDVAAPRGRLGARLIVTIEANGLRRTYPGGAQLYWCQIDGP